MRPDTSRATRRTNDREHAVDLAKLLQFLSVTQPDTYEALGIDEEGPKRTQFLHRLQGEIAKRGRGGRAGVAASSTARPMWTFSTARRRRAT